jgi:DNA glycosylase AlkZ-like
VVKRAVKAPSPDRVLSSAELNRATLARQMLLKREQAELLPTIERLVALQAQEPAGPYIALWARLRGFDPKRLHEAFHARQVVKGTLMRVTLHAVTAEDYGLFWPAIAPSMRSWRQRVLGGAVDERLLDRLAEQALAYASEPRSGAELRAHLPALDGVGPNGQQDAFWAVRPQAAFVMAPGDYPMSFGRRPMFVAARSWLDEPLATEEAGLEHLVRRYLSGFGPASTADIAQFTGVQVGRLKPVVERLSPELRTFSDERKRLLYDVSDGLLPSGEVPAPVRFLPMWDSTLMAYQDRSRVVPEPYRRRVVQVNGDWLPTFTVDGYVAGLWRAEAEDGRTTIDWAPFEPLRPGVEDEVQAEADRLARFIGPLEPKVYSRMANTWMKKPQPD